MQEELIAALIILEQQYGDRVFREEQEIDYGAVLRVLGDQLAKQGRQVTIDSDTLQKVHEELLNRREAPNSHVKVPKEHVLLFNERFFLDSQYAVTRIASGEDRIDQLTQENQQQEKLIGYLRQALELTNQRNQELEKSRDDQSDLISKLLCNWKTCQDENEALRDRIAGTETGRRSQGPGAPNE